MISSPNGTVSSPDGMVPSDHVTVRRVIPLRGARGGHNRRPIAARGSLELCLQPLRRPHRVGRSSRPRFGSACSCPGTGRDGERHVLLHELAGRGVARQLLPGLLRDYGTGGPLVGKAAHLGVIFIPAAVYHFTVTALR